MTSNEERSSGIKQHAPTMLMVLSSVVFMNAKDVITAVIAGFFATAGIVWTIRRQRTGVQSLGEPAMTLGTLHAEPPERMKPWYAVAFFLFLFMGIGSLLAMTEADAGVRLGMSLISFSICGSWLIMLSRRTRILGLILFGGGFTLAGGCFYWAAYSAAISDEASRALNMTRFILFGTFLFLPGISVLIQAMRHRGATEIYESGVLAPQGFAAWENAKRIELVEANGKTMLAVTNEKDWTFWINVPEDSISRLGEFIDSKRATTVDNPSSET